MKRFLKIIVLLSIVFGLSFFMMVTTRSVRASEIVISEIMYNPVGSTDDTDADEFEFIELYNPGSSAVDLSGTSFTDGITFVFPDGSGLGPEERLVIVRNREAFQTRYPSVTNVAEGVYEGKLNNGGEQVRLIDADGDKLISFEYMDRYD